MRIFAFVLCMTIVSFGWAAETALNTSVVPPSSPAKEPFLQKRTLESTPSYWRRSHRFFLKPDLAWNRSDSIRDGNAIFESYGSQAGIHAGYELLRPRSLYVATELFYSTGTQQFDIKVDNGEIFSFRRGLSNAIWNGLIGYTFALERLLVTPFTGLGEYFVHMKKGFREFSSYVPLGVKVRCPIFQDVMEIGISLQRLQYFYVHLRHEEERGSRFLLKDNIYGYEIAAPLSFQEEEIGWGLSLEPYYFKVDNSSLTSIAYFGGRLAAVRQF